MIYFTNNSSDVDSDFDPDEFIDQIAADTAHNFLHDAVPVPKHQCPFRREETIEAFEIILNDIKSGRGAIPQGYYLRPNEWDEDGYPSYEIIRSGRRGAKELRIALPDQVWRPRAEIWVKALVAMELLLEMDG